MFGNWAAWTTRPDENLPKKTPPPATPVQLPEYVLRERQQYSGPIDLFKIFAAVRTFENIRPFHVEALNLQIKENAPLDLLVPAEFLPSSEWENPPSSHGDLNASPPSPLATTSSHHQSNSSQTLSNGAAIPSHEAYFLRKKELLVDNDTCYKSIGPQSSQGSLPTVRLVHYRKFYETLVLVGGYWDTSLDNLPSHEAERKVTNSPEPQQHSQETTRDEEHPSDEQVYTGRRIDTGKKMPESFRTDLIRTFIEPIIWSFGCRAEKPQIVPRLQLQGLLLPVRQNAIVYRAPKDRMKSRAGMIEGPLLGVQCRPETAFDENEAIADLLREVGAMLLLAEQRDREGKQDPILNQSEWWATERRWGGGTGTAIAINGDDSQESFTPEMMKGNKRMARAMDAWRTVRGPASRWERKVTYLHIGKSKKQQFDDVYLISSLFHHISVLRLRVDPRYLEFIEKGPPTPDFKPLDQDWYILQLDRSSWYDLLCPEDRLQAMRAIWGVTGFLMRDVDSE